MTSIGEYQVKSLVTEHFSLDGGAMFGSVPKTLWNKRIAADEQNRIPLASRSLVIKYRDRVILVDVGCGRKWEDKLRGIYDISYQGPSLSESVPEVTDVVLTHLHFDHAGGVSCLDAEGKLGLTFPNATHYLLKTNWQTAQAPSLRERASYLRENIDVLEQGNLVLVDDGAEVFPGMTLNRSDGHTVGLGWVLLRSESSALAFPSDLIPTSHHVPVPYVMGYDLWAAKTMQEKTDFLERAVSESWIIVFEHDRDTEAGRVAKDDRGGFYLSEKISL